MFVRRLNLAKAQLIMHMFAFFRLRKQTQKNYWALKLKQLKN